MEYFADLHIHIGQAKKRPIKITASRNLTLDNIYDCCLNRKGIDIIGIVDCASPYVLEEIAEQLKTGVVSPLDGGGLRYKDKLTIILGAEIETTEEKGVAHSIAFFPYYEQIKEFSTIVSAYITNITLSSQKARLSAKDLFKIVWGLGGELVPAHVFTPFKSFYGSCYDRLSLAFEDKIDYITAIELGLSADTDFADTIVELSDKAFLSNSDAHSLEKIVREYNKMNLKFPDFNNVFSALRHLDNNCIIANYGLNPKLGKYHRTFCPVCSNISKGTPPVTKCLNCNNETVTLGVLDRITLIADYKMPIHPKHRPSYHYQIPLEFIPGIGKKTIEKLLLNFGTEMDVIHNTDIKELSEVIGEQKAKNIVLAREGKLNLQVGGGGFYGKVINRNE
ncbi:endonuclease Q family protein [Tepidanaerobacter acetatoxydans]|uniref:endonuclease Q family protein n=1 Tax=Tepidanaerobacter acetatoxydans TaxID=499229 RepID=UPI001BD49509|nr:endonuclease Q family protein [Tepidanaerobacter acetatoxydans]